MKANGMNLGRVMGIDVVRAMILKLKLCGGFLLLL